MVVSEQPLASGVGVEVLERGGNAADAAVAVALALAVVLPQAGNLAGGGFAIWVAHDPGEPPLCLDFRECAPAGLTAGHFLDESGQRVEQRSLAGGLAVGVPGSARGLYEFQRRLGRLPFEQVVAPAIALARRGFTVDERLAAAIAEERETLARSPGARELFLPQGEPLAAGQRLRQEELARTLERYAQEGPEGFYQGPIAEALVSEVRAAGGVLELADLESYQVHWREPLRGWFRGLELVTVPPPSSGGVAILQVLAMLDGFPLDEERMGALRSVDSAGDGISARALHWWIEALRLAFAERAEHLGDPDFHAVELKELLSPERLSRLRVAIGESANPGVRPLPAAAHESGQTTHLSILDQEGNAVSLTTTLNTTFGSGLLVRGGGFLLNNEIDDFALQAGSPNAYALVGGAANSLAPGKRPLSSMTPLVVRESGEVVRLVLGSRGGPRIITSLLEVLLRVEVYGQSLQEAVAAPRLHQQWSPPETELEPGWPPYVLQLRNRGHVLVQQDETWGSVQAIAVEVGGEPVGVSDPRSGGSARATRE
jgi:gamma-glutamyltranspeptidase/glutathione hydrolase